MNKLLWFTGIILWHIVGYCQVLPDTSAQILRTFSDFKKYHKKLPDSIKTEDVHNNYNASVKAYKEIKKQSRYFNSLNRLVFTGQLKKASRRVQYLYEKKPGFVRMALHNNLSQWLYFSRYHQKKLNRFLSEVNQNGIPEIVKRTEALYWVSELILNPNLETKEIIAHRLLNLRDDETSLNNHNSPYIFAAARIMRERSDMYDSLAQALLFKGYTASLYQLKNYKDSKHDPDSLGMREMARLGLEHAYFNFARLTKAPDSVLSYLIFCNDLKPDSLDNEVADRFNSLFHLHANGIIGGYDYQSNFFNLLSSTRTPNIMLEGLKRLGIAAISKKQKQEIQEVYQQAMPEKPFTDFWDKVIEASLSMPIRYNFLEKPPTDSLWTLVYFWGSWCRSCIADLPDVEKAYKKWVLPSKLHFIAYDFQTPNAIDFLKKRSFSFTSQKVTESFTEPNGIYAYPTHLLVKPDGRFLELRNENWHEQIEVILGLK